MAKRRMRHSKMMKMPMKKMCGCSWWHYGSLKFAAMAFILFVITVWPAAMELVHSIHWGWFLVATLVFGALHMMKCKNCKMH